MHHCGIVAHMELAQEQRHEMQPSNADVMSTNTKTHTVFSFICMA